MEPRKSSLWVVYLAGDDRPAEPSKTTVEAESFVCFWPRKDVPGVKLGFFRLARWWQLKYFLNFGKMNPEGFVGHGGMSRWKLVKG